MLRTGEHYLKSLNDGRNVWVGNTQDRQRRHPPADARLRAAHRRILRPAPARRICRTSSPSSTRCGVRRSMMWFQHRSKEELVRKRKYHEFIMRQFVAASMPRTPDSQNYMLVTYIDDPGALGEGLDRRRRPRARRQYPQFLAIRDGPRPGRGAAFRRSAGRPLRSERARQFAGAAHRRDQRRRHPGQRRQGDRHRFGLRRLPAPRRVLPSRRQRRPDHLRRLPGQFRRASPSSAARAWWRPIRSSIRSPRRATSSTPR